MAGKYTPLEQYLRDLPQIKEKSRLVLNRSKKYWMRNYPPPRLKTNDGGIMRPKATMSISVHGQMLAGRLSLLISARNE
jgi:hypothetical protein